MNDFIEMKHIYWWEFYCNVTSRKIVLMSIITKWIILNETSDLQQK